VKEWIADLFQWEAEKAMYKYVDSSI